MATSASAKRGERSGKHVKWSVTIPPHLAQLAEEKVAAGEASSVSALVAQALERNLTVIEDDLDRLITQWVDAGEVTITDEDRAWSRQVLAL